MSGKRKRSYYYVVRGAIAFGLWLFIFVGMTPQVSADTGGYPFAGKPCAHAPYTVSGRCANYDWGEGLGGLISPYGYAYRNCTDYVAWRLGTLGVSPAYYKGLGHAKNWAFSGIGKGLRVDGVPMVGSVAVRLTGAYGHMAFVEGVSATGVMQIAQYNNDSDGTFSVQAGTPAALGFTHFVHFEDFVPQPPPPPPAAITPEPVPAQPAPPVASTPEAPPAPPAPPAADTQPVAVKSQGDAEIIPAQVSADVASTPEVARVTYAVATMPPPEPEPMADAPPPPDAPQPAQEVAQVVPLDTPTPPVGRSAKRTVHVVAAVKDKPPKVPASEDHDVSQVQGVNHSQPSIAQTVAVSDRKASLLPRPRSWPVALGLVVFLLAQSSAGVTAYQLGHRIRVLYARVLF